VPHIEVIVLRSGLPPGRTARRLAEVLDAETVPSGPEVVSLRRPARAVDGGWLVFEVLANDYGDDDPRRHGETVYDHYDTAVELWLVGEIEPGPLHQEVRRLFDELTAELPWPALHTDINGMLYQAYTPGLGRRDFPPGTPYDQAGRHLWEPYARPAEQFEQS
jgi:hypothetical protein